MIDPIRPSPQEAQFSSETQFPQTLESFTNCLKAISENPYKAHNEATKFAENTIRLHNQVKSLL